MIEELLRLIRKLRPFKGNCAYESQVGPWVLQWRHDGYPWKKSYPITGKGFTLGKLHIWRDQQWLNGKPHLRNLLNFYRHTIRSSNYKLNEWRQYWNLFIRGR